MTVKFERLTELEELAQDIGWWRTYEQSFPEPYRASRAALLRVFTHPMVMFLRCRLDGETVALATMQMLVEPAVGFLGYLAVKPEARRHGIGRQLLAACMRLSEEGLRDLGMESHGMLLECENPSKGAADPADWYAQDGFRSLKTAYEQPPLNGSEPVPMRLLFSSREPGLRLTPFFEISLIKALYEQKYRASYGISDGVIQELLRRCSSQSRYRKSS